MFIPARINPNSAASSSSRRVQPLRRGRQIASRTTLAVTSRRRTAPPGPIRSNSVAATAEPNWTDAIPPRTRPADGARDSSPASGATVALTEAMTAIVVAGAASSATHVVSSIVAMARGGGTQRPAGSPPAIQAPDLPALEAAVAVPDRATGELDLLGVLVEAATDGSIVAAGIRIRESELRGLSIDAPDASGLELVDVVL